MKHLAIKHLAMKPLHKLKRPPLVYTLSFFLPILLLAFVYLLRGIYPFGDECFLRSDMYHQYAPFHAALMDKLKNGGSLLYSWDIGMGMNFTALYAYYLATPFNWLLLLVPQSSLIEVMSLFIFIKIGLCGLTFSHYLCRHFQTQNPVIAGISVFYSLSAYICSYSWNLMWLDCIWLFPLILLGLERLIKENKGFLYCITLGLCILSNYYIAIMVCIFCVLYFILLTLTQSEALEGWWRKALSFTLYSALAGGFAAFLLLPEFFALQLTVSGDMNFPKSLARYFSVFEMLSRQMMMVEPAIFSAHEPNIYSGMLVFLLVPLYALNPKTNAREKAGKFLLLFLFYLSFNLNIPNYIWHGFHFPNSLPCRQSFIFTFLLLIMSYEGFRGLKKYSAKEITGVLAGCIGLFLLMEHLIPNDGYPYYIIYISAAFLALYGMLAFVYRSNKLAKPVCLLLFLLLISAEAFINTEETSVNTTGRSAYVSDNKAISSLLDTISDTDFYRVEKLKRRSKNDAAWHHYHGVSLFSSTANAGVGNFLSGLGGENSTNSYAYYGATPLVESILSVRYVLGKDKMDDTSLRSIAASEDSNYLYQNTYTLPLGFWLPSNLEEEWSIKMSNPFSVQNRFADLAAHVSPLFTSVDTIITDNIMKIEVPVTQHIYVYLTSSGENFTATFTPPEGGETSTQKFTGVKQNYIFDLGVQPAGMIINITTAEQDFIQGYVYGLQEDNFISLYQTLSGRAMEVLSYDDTHLSGTIYTDKEGILFTSIPYEKGWTVTLDGQKVEVHAFKDAFLSIDLTPGYHEIAFSYSPYGLNIGIAITAVSLLLFCIIIFMTYQKTILRMKAQTEDEDTGIL